MRLRVLELPAQVIGGNVETPFSLVIDQCAAEDAATLDTEALKTATGAASVLVFRQDVELPDQDLRRRPPRKRSTGGSDPARTTA